MDEPRPQPRPPTEPADIRFNFACRMCGSVLEACASQCGTPGRCPTCAAVFHIPTVDARTGLAMGMGDSGSMPQDPTPVHAYAAAGDKAPQIVRLDDGSSRIACPRCNHTSSVECNYCSKCGFPFTMEGANRAARVASDGFGIISFAVGVVSLPLTLCAHEIGAVGAFGAAVLAWTSLNRSTEGTSVRRSRGLAISGLVLGLAGLTFAVLKFAGVF